MTEMRGMERSGTIKNYLDSWKHGTHESLLFEVAEKLYQLQIDFDEIRDNRLEIMWDKINHLQDEIDKMKKEKSEQKNI